MMQVRELETADPDRATSLARARHDIFQSPECLRVEDDFRGTCTRLLAVEEVDSALLMPIVFEAVLRWAHDRDDRDYFLGDGLQESLRHFKAGFTRSQQPAETVRIIVDPVEYRRFAGGWDSTSGPPAETGCGFFSCYRTPPAAPG